ncbi:MAG TPA: glutamate ABC transporter substrate-binding protein [Dermatophilaceae bacterium]|nr:glutamate ABC transporter substrate-binding protein [Dermatophilaceae bacterium]
MRTRLVAAAASLAALLAGCSSGGVYPATPLPASSTPAPTTSTTTGAAPACANPTASYQPDGLPGPGDLPAGSYMQAIRARGRLIAGVSADTLQLGARNPLTGQIEGFDIDMLRLVADAIFGDPSRIELRVITAADRIPVLANGTVDIVARNFSITCARWQQIAFSAEYYRSGQKVLVPLGSRAQTLSDLKDKRVCAPAGSTSLAKIGDFAGVIPVAAATHTGCLVLLQQGQIDAITGDDTVLAGLSAQDPYAKVTAAKAFTVEPYGLGIANSHPEFVRFVNAVLERAKRDGTWTRAYNTWLAGALGPAPAPPAAVYGRTP